jgi:hypothetical protein
MENINFKIKLFLNQSIKIKGRLNIIFNDIKSLTIDELFYQRTFDLSKISDEITDIDNEFTNISSEINKVIENITDDEVYDKYYNIVSESEHSINSLISKIYSLVRGLILVDKDV